MADVEIESRNLTRFPDGADVDAKREFGKTLLAALDELDIEPGDPFAVVRPDDLVPEEDENITGEEATRVLLALFDWRRGTLDGDELVQEILMTLKPFVQDYEPKECAFMGLPHTGALGA